MDLLGALGATGGPAEVDVLARVVEDSSQPAGVRTEALGALAGIGPAAAPVVERVLDPPRAPASWWRPPAFEGDLAAIGRPVSRETLMAALQPPDGKEYWRLVRLTSSARVPLTDGASLVVFADGWLGNAADLWAVRVGADG
jgi:hypothetical protein